jgi:SAM-dependent methyltransferase
MTALQTVTLKCLLHSVGRLSDGVRIAIDSGLTSGRMLDYIYRNQPSGKLLIGKLLDRAFLSHKAWQAVRSREQLLVATLKWTIRQQLDAMGEAILLDIASGPARYVQDALSDFKDTPVAATCWDLSETCLLAGQTAAASRDLQNITFVRADAMDARSYGRLSQRPNIVIASGFYDWFQDDDLIRKSMRLVSDALPNRGCFVFTIQTGHSDVHLVNQLFSGFDGEALKMKTIPIDAVHDWIKAMGFAIPRFESDVSRCYVVTVAQKDSAAVPPVAKVLPTLCPDAIVAEASRP